MIADAVEQGGASEIVIHGRTKVDGYQPDKIDWLTIGKIKNRLTIPVIANGEIMSRQSAQQCIAQSQTTNIMLGRGILTIPNLGNVIRNEEFPLSWDEVLLLLQQYAQSDSVDESVSHKPLYFSSRIKQWLSYLKQHYSQAHQLLQQIRTLKTQQDIIDGLQNYKI